MNATDVARLTDEEIFSLAEEAFALRSRQDALLCLLGGELDRRESWRAHGATSLAAWFQDRLGLSAGSARTYATVAEPVSDFPHLAAGLAEGLLNLDKLRSVVAVVTTETEARWAEAAGEARRRTTHPARPRTFWIPVARIGAVRKLVGGAGGAGPRLKCQRDVNRHRAGRHTRR